MAGLGKIDPNSALADTIAHRRLQVARLRLRGMSTREITKAMAEANFVNPETQQPWDLATITRDCQANRRAWAREHRETVERHQARHLAEIAEVKREAWKTPADKLDTILRALKREAELLGLDAPQKTATEITGADGGPVEFAWKPTAEQEKAADAYVEAIARAAVEAIARAASVDDQAAPGEVSPN